MGKVGTPPRRYCPEESDKYDTFFLQPFWDSKVDDAFTIGSPGLETIERTVLESKVKWQVVGAYSEEDASSEKHAS